VPLLIGALDRGVQVEIVGDVFTKVDTNMQRRLRHNGALSHEHTAEINNTLRQHGAHVAYIGKLGRNFIQKRKGRCHSKITILDDTVFTFGGINFTDSALQAHDYMLKIEDAKLADFLQNLVHDISKNKPLPMLQHEIDASATLLFDNGTPDDSIIYKTACLLAAKAKRIHVVSQMCPSGLLARPIRQAESFVYFTRPSQMLPPANIAQAADQQRYRLKNLYTGKTYLHAKFMLFEEPDGTKHVLSGSNNFSWRGVAYGTKEIALHSTDPKLYDTLYDYLQHTILA